MSLSESLKVVSTAWSFEKPLTHVYCEINENRVHKEFYILFLGLTIEI